MGILSRKMAMPNQANDAASKPLVTTEPSSLPVRMNNMVKMVEPEWKMEKNQNMQPVLGHKNYSTSVAPLGHTNEIGVSPHDQSHNILAQQYSLFEETGMQGNNDVKRQ